ncbi:hypothetical protein [Devosia submarina]|nr:hypothetical protein [Devosia submarina]
MKMSRSVDLILSPQKDDIVATLAFSTLWFGKLTMRSQESEAAE